jgi:hypothetical protein
VKALQEQTIAMEINGNLVFVEDHWNADCFQGFCQSMQVIPGIVYQIRPQLLPSTYVPAHYL